MKSLSPAEEWLVISYYYGVDGLACSHHIEDRISALNGMGIETCILRRSGMHSAAFMRLEKYSTYLDKFKTATGFTRIMNGLYFALALFRGITLMLQQWDEVICVLDLTADGYDLTKRKRFSRIYSTGGPMGAHIAALLIATRTRLPVTVEFQDPLPFQYPRYFHRLALKVERLLMKHANCIFLTRQAAVSAAKRCGTPVPAHIYPGAEHILHPEAPHSTGSIHIAHFGRLYQGRNTTIFLRALENLIQSQPKLQSALHVHCYGALDRTALQSTTFSFPGVLHLHERISRRESIRIMATMNVLLLIQHVDAVSTETIPSKVYEYLHTGRPILALVYQNSELSCLLNELGHIVVEADDEGGIKDALGLLLQNWQDGKLPTPSPSPYTTAAAASSLWRG